MYRSIRSERVALGLSRSGSAVLRGQHLQSPELLRASLSFAKVAVCGRSPTPHLHAVDQLTVFAGTPFDRRHVRISHDEGDTGEM